MTGAVIVGVLLPVLLISLVFDHLGLISNPYFGFLLYVVMAPLFVLGVVLLLLGGLLFRNREDLGVYTVEYIKEQISRPGRYTRIRKSIYLTVAITLLNVFVVGLVSYSSFRYTNSPGFCGQFCHEVMEPQYVAYRNSPHSKVACVECHLGKDARWAERSRFTGLRQLYAVATDSYRRPIPSPVEALRPGRRTCEQCHLPEKFHGSKLVVKEEFLPDEVNTRVKTVMLMKVGSGDLEGQKAHGIHWHVSQAREVYYRHADRKREMITEVRVVEKGKRDVIYLAPAREVQVRRGSGLRRMDCIDCHNRPTHIFRSPEDALDRKLSLGIIPCYLPYIKRQALEVISRDYPTVEDARVNISRDLRGWYRRHYPDLTERNPTLLERAVQGVQQAYQENVFPRMKVAWGTYKNFLGHEGGSGCFRCHGRLRERDSGRYISSDCNLCHVILAEREVRPRILETLGSRDGGEKTREETP